MPAQQQQGDWNLAPLQDVYGDTAGGVYSAVEPYQIAANQAAYLKNADFDTPGVRRRRLGSAPFGSPGVSPGGLSTWYPVGTSDDVQYLVGVWDTHVWRSSGNKQWSMMGSSGISMPNALYTFAQGTCTQYFGPPTSATIVHPALYMTAVHPWTGATNTQLCEIHSDMDMTATSLCPRALTWWQGRLWLFNLSNPALGPNTLVWSTILDGDNIDTNNNIRINPIDGDEGMAIAPARGGQPRLYLFKRHSIYALDVVWSGGTYIPSTQNSLDTTQSRLVLVSENVGCVAPLSIVYSSGSGDSDIFFLSHDGYRSLKRVEQDVAGGAGLPISDPIKDVIDRINWSYAYNAVATVFDNKVFLAIPVDGSVYPNLVAVFDLALKVWVGEYDWKVRSFTPSDLLGDLRLFFQWRLTTGETLTGLGYTEAAHCFQGLATGYYTDPGATSIVYEERTRAFFFDSFGAKKRWDWVEYFFEPSTTTATMEVYTKVDEYDWTLVDARTLVPTFEYPVLPARLPWAFEQPARQMERISLIDVPPGQRLQLKLVSNSPSIFGVRLTRISAWPYVEKWE